MIQSADSGITAKKVLVKLLDPQAWTDTLDGLEQLSVF
jgi:hypothetical protein